MGISGSVVVVVDVLKEGVGERVDVDVDVDVDGDVDVGVGVDLDVDDVGSDVGIVDVNAIRDIADVINVRCGCDVRSECDVVYGFVMCDIGCEHVRMSGRMVRERTSNVISL